MACKYCKKKIDDFDNHALKCCDKGALMQRHDSIKKCVNDLCVACELLVDKEPSVFSFKNGHSSHNHHKKDQRCLDLLIHEFSQNISNLCLDVLIANPFLKLLVIHPKVLAVAEIRENEKNGTYLNDCYKLIISFHPFIMDIYGGIILIRFQASCQTCSRLRAG